MASKRRVWVRRAAITLGVFAVVLVIASFALGRYLRAAVSAEELQTLLNDALVSATDGLYTVSLERIEWGSTGVSPRLHGVSVMLDRDVLAERDAAGTLPALIVQLQHATVDVTGVDPWRLLRGRGLRAYSVEIDGPLIQLAGLEDLIARGSRADTTNESEGVEPDVVPAAQDAPGPSAVAPAASTPPQVRISRVRLNDAELESYRRQEADTGDIRDTFQLYESFRGVNLAFDDLDFTNPDPRRLLFADDFRLEVQEYFYRWPDGLHEENHGPIRLSTREGSIEIHNFDTQPRFDRREYAAGDGPVPRARTIKIREAAIYGVDFAELLANRAFHAATLRMVESDISIVADAPTPTDDSQGPTGQVTAPLTSARPGALLTEVLAGLPSIDVDELRIEDGDFELLVDRHADGSWRDAPVRYHGLEDLEFEVRGYHSGPDVPFDASRPLFADGWSVGAGSITLTIGGEGPHRVVMDNWRSESESSDLVVDSLQIEPVFERRNLPAARGPLPEAHSLHTGPVALTGINYGSLIESVDVEIDRVSISAPVLQTVRGEGGGSPATPRPDIAGRAPAEAISAILLGLPNVRVGDVDLEDARWEMVVDRVEGEWLAEPVRRLLVDEVDLALDLVSHDAGTGYEPGQPFLTETAAASIGAVVFAPGDGFQELTVTGIAMDSGRHDVTIESVVFTPTTEDLPTLVDRVQRQSLANIETGRITVRGRVLGDYVDTGEWEADLIEVQAPLVQIYETVRPASDTGADPGSDNTDGLADTLASIGLLHVDEVVIRDGIYERRQASPGYSWEEIPPPVETIQNLNLTIRGFDTDPALGARRLLLSEAVEVSADEIATPLGEDGGSLALRGFDLSSDDATLRIRSALLSTRSVAGDNDFEFGAIELDNVPYGRLFRSLIEPRYRGTTPVIAAMVDRDLRLRVDGLQGALDDGARLVEVASITGAAATGELRVDRFDFKPAARDADPATAEVELANQELAFQTDFVNLTGVDYVALAATGALVADSLEVAPPVFEVIRGLTADEGAEREPGAPDPGGVVRSPAEALDQALEDFPVVSIDRFRVDDITLRELRTLGGEAVREFSDIDIAVDGLDLRPDRAPDDPAGLLYATDIRVRMPRQRTWLDNTVYEVEVGPIAVSTGRGQIELGAVAYRPPFDEERFLTRTAIREGDRVEVTAGNLRLDGVDLRRFLTRRALHIATVTLTDWEVSILSDKHKPRNPNPGIAWYPHETVQAIGLDFAVDEVVLENGAVRYSERHREGTRVGSIWWDRLQGRLTNLSNDPARMTLETPAVLSVSARMYDEAFLNLEWRLPLLEPGPTMSYRGEMSPINAEHLSAILEPLEGLRITKGIVDQASFHVDVTNSHATGEFVALYRDLGLQLVDRNTGGRNLGRRLLSLAADVIMPHNNRDAVGRPARVGEIDWVPAPEDPFFKVFWVAVRGGILDLVTP